MNEQDALQFAITAAKKSPCKKSKRGVVLWINKDGNPNVYNHGIVQGYNHLPRPFICTGSEECREACSKICVHAEQDAIVNAQRDLRGYQMLHVKVVDDEAVPSGPPSCWQCSRLILISGIELVWLLHEEGLRGYKPEFFHEATLRHCDLPRMRVR